MSVIEILKSESSFFGGLWKSKKLGLAGTWAAACFILGSQTTDIKVLIASLAAGGAAVLAYVLGQSYVEGQAARASGVIPPNGEPEKK